MIARVLFSVALFLSFGGGSVPRAKADHEVTFRTPARRYGSAYSIKLTLMRNGFTYDVPVWVKPDQKQSSIDRDQLAELGWSEKNFQPELMTISEEPLEIPKFKSMKSDWAFLPEFAKNCCYAVIGQDILKDYEVLFDPRPPVHLEWANIVPAEEGPRPIYPKESAKFQKDLAALFSVDSVHGTVDGKKIDFSNTPYRVNLFKSEITFEPSFQSPTAATRVQSAPILQYHFQMPKRDFVVTEIAGPYQKSARKIEFKSSLKIERINNFLISTMDKFEIEDYLKGKKSKTLVFATQTKTYTFDFEKNEFTESQPIPTYPRWH
jgi:hypothetical protein